MGGNTLLMAAGTGINEKELKRLSEAFRKMMSTLYKEEGATLRMELLGEPDVTGFIDTHASILDTSLRQMEMSDTMREHLRRSNWMFSGLKTFHELNEAFPSLIDEEGNKKPFERFLNDVRKIDNTYNRNYLRAEYNFAGAAAQMAERWEEAAKDDEEIYLQYRTAHDGKVRPEHAELHGITLPVSDRFWEEYYPPNGWNCFIAGTPVLTPAGWKNIEKITKGESVIGGSGNHRIVVGTHSKTVNGKMVSIFSKRTITTCTENHRFLTHRGWISAGSVKPGDIIVKVGKVSSLDILINAVYNSYTFLRYAFMSPVTQREPVPSLAVNNKIESGNIKINNIGSKKAPRFKQTAHTREMFGKECLRYRQWQTMRTHTLRMLGNGTSSGDRCLDYDVRPAKRSRFLKFACHLTDKLTVGFGLALSYMKSLFGKSAVNTGKHPPCILAPLAIVEPLRSDGIASVTYGNIINGHYFVNGSIADTPIVTEPSEAPKLGKIPLYGGIPDIHAFNGFNSFYDFLRKTFLHTRYVLVTDKITNNTANTIVHNLSVDIDESYVVPMGIVHNCRCTVEKVLRFKSKPTPHEEAMKRAEKVFKKDKKGMFKFNPGKEQRTFPAYNPYTISKCRSCDKSNLSLAKGDSVPQNQLCAACQELRRTRELGSLLKRIDKAKGREYIDLLKLITAANEFKPYSDGKGIFYAGGENDKDFDNLINAARKAASIGYDVYLLPNIKDCRTSDYILVKKGFIDRLDLKTITGKNSVSNRLKESVGQTDRVILNMTVKYNARKLAGEIKEYFEMNDTAKSVMVFKGNRCIEVKKSNIDRDFLSKFRKEYSK